ncbi:MAG: ribose 5-phosphate isomerase B [Clostridia bacterium]|nr:ribose 5-phosphate isomerase B [Clostridia bacterium]
MNIAIASDHAGFEMKQSAIEYLIKRGHNVTDYGTYNTQSCDYPDYCISACKTVNEGLNQYAILICGTGIGMSITANKLHGIRCGLCTNSVCATLTRAHNDANALAMGARVIDMDTCYQIIDAFLNTNFEGGRHQIRVDKINALDGKRK